MLLYLLQSHEVHTIKLFKFKKKIFREVSYFAIVAELHALFVYVHIFYECMYTPLIREVFEIVL